MEMSRRQDIINHGVDSPSEEVPSIKDKVYAEKTTYGSGAVRDVQQNKGRCDLMPVVVVAELYDSDVLRNISLFMEDKNTDHLIKALLVFADVQFGSVGEMCLEVSKHFKEGAMKYGERNWEKGIPIHSYLDSGIRHYIMHREGHTDERHDRAFAWNMMCATWTCKYRANLYESFCESLNVLSR